jgi:hypothetical protein
MFVILAAARPILGKPVELQALRRGFSNSTYRRTVQPPVLKFSRPADNEPTAQYLFDANTHGTRKRPLGDRTRVNILSEQLCGR